MSDDQRNKAHNVRNKGAKFAKKEQHQKERRGLDVQPNRGQSNKAFTGPGAGSRKVHLAQRAIERKSAHIHMPVDDKQRLGLVDDPPLLVAVVGPPGCGKTTLVRSMAKFYANRNIQRLRGPVTVVAGRSQRVTLLEVPNTLSAMCDAAKIADLVIIMVDGAFGFEMETFEFLNIAQIHGFPKIIGVVSHLDQMKTNKQLKKSKRVLRHRFWHEVAEGCKILCLAPMINNLYRSSDVLKLHRLLVNTVPKVQNWRNTHGCMLIDRFEDITDANALVADDKCNRTIAFYGYMRGHAMRADQTVHIPGVGDFEIAHMSHQEDPCPGVVHNDKSSGNKLRHLSTKQKKIYAPHCDLGGVVFDDDAIYVYEDADRQNTSRSGEGLEMLRELQRANAIDDQMDRRPMNFVNDDTLELDVGPVASGSDDDDDEDDDDEDDDDVHDLTHARRRNADLGAFGNFGGDDDENDDEDVDDDDEAAELAPRHPQAADSSIIGGRSTRFDWSDPVYQQKLKLFFVTGAWSKAGDGDDDEDEEGAEGDADDADSKGYESVDEDAEEYTRAAADAAAEEDASSADDGDGDDDDRVRPTKSAAKKPSTAAPAKPHLAATAGRPSARGAGASRGPAATNDSDGDEEVNFDAAAYADDDDTGVQHRSDVQGLLDYFISKDLASDSKAADFMDDITGGLTRGAAAAEDAGFDAEEAQLMRDHGENAPEVDDYVKKKMAKKREFDAQYDEGSGKNNTTQFYQRLLDEQAAKKRALTETLETVGEDIDKRISLVGYFGGLYVRMVLKNVPVEFIRNFDPTVPLFAGGLNPGEDQMGFVTGRIKRHRWYPKILKAQDPVVLSMGWRRIQTQPIFAVDDPNGRHRYLKYTPKHMHCFCTFYGPVTPPNTGFVVIPVKNARLSNFRLTASGFTTGMDAGSSVVKKLKLTGVPQKVQKTTCFVKGMFNSDIEAAKFVGAKVKAVSGLRGIIKKVLKGKNGLVRCSFEDKLLMSDIVFLRAWKGVEPPRYCVNVLNALKSDWEGMRPMAQLRRDMGVDFEKRPESEYREVTRKAVPEGPVRVMLSRTLRTNLPFEHKEEFIPVTKERGFERRVRAATTAAPEPHELKKQALLAALTKRDETMGAHQKKLRHDARQRAVAQHKKEAEIMDRKIKVAKKESAKRAEFKSQHKTRANAGKKR